MNAEERERLVAEAEQRVRREIAAKMREDRMPAEMIRKYTGIAPEETPVQTSAYDVTAKQVACEMLLKGLPLESIAMATGVPFPVLQELKAQLPE